MRGMISDVRLVNSNNQVAVAGDFDPLRNDVKSAKVLFLIVQGQGAKAAILNGEAIWNGPAKTWNKTIDNVGIYADGSGGAKLTPGGVVRGIAHSIAIIPAQPSPGTSQFDPPQIGALTWCVETPLT